MATKKTVKRTSKKSTRTRKSAPKAPKVLAVTRKDGISLMKTFGFTAPHKLTNEKLLMRLRKTGQYMEAFDGTLSGGDKELVAAIIAAGDNISVDASDPAFAEPKETATKKTKKTATKKTKKTATKRTTTHSNATSSAEKDRFGNRVGSKTAAVNAMLSRKPITMAEIKEAVGGTYYNHINALIKRGKVRKTAEGYSLRLKVKKHVK